MSPVVLLLNLQNEIVHPDGEIAAHGNAAQVADRNVLGNVATLLAAARPAGLPIIYAGNGYHPDYSNLNQNVPLFAANATRHRLRNGSWEAEFHRDIAPQGGDTVLLRGGLGLFASTDVAARLPHPSGTRIFVAGVSTRLVVEAVVFELTDRGYAVTVVEDCCAANSVAAHTEAIQTLTKFARISPTADAVATFYGV